MRKVKIALKFFAAFFVLAIVGAILHAVLKECGLSEYHCGQIDGILFVLCFDYITEHLTT